MRKLLIFVFAASIAAQTVKVNQGGTSATTPDAALTNLGGVHKSGDTMTGPLNVKKLNTTWHTSQWCTTPGTLNQTCIQNAINDAVANGPTGYVDRHMGEIYVDPGLYTINSTVTVPRGAANLVIAGQGTSSWGSTLIAAAGLSGPILQVNADSVTIHGLVFNGLDSSHPCLTLGTSSDKTFDSRIYDDWYFQCFSGLHLVNYGGGQFYANDFDYGDGYGIVGSTTLGDVSANNLLIENNRFYGLFQPLYLEGTGSTITGTDPNYGHVVISGNEFDGARLDSPAVTITAVPHVSISGNTFRGNNKDDLLVTNTRNVSVTGNVFNSPGRNAIFANSVSGFSAVGNTIRNCNIGSYAGTTAAINSDGLGNSVIANNTVTADSGLNLCSYSITAGATSSGTVISGNNAVWQVTGDYSISDTTAMTKVMGKVVADKVVGASETGATVAEFGQFTTSNPKQLAVISNPSTNTLDLQAVQQNVGFNQALRLNPQGGDVYYGTGDLRNTHGVILPGTLTGTHGTGEKVQLSDGTGTTGNCAHFAADGSLTDGSCSGTGTGTNMKINGGTDLASANLATNSGAGQIDVSNPAGSTINFTLHDEQTKNSIVPNSFAGIRFGNSGSADSAATAAQVVSVIGSTSVTNAGTAATLSAQYIDWNQTTGPTSIANKPTLNATTVGLGNVTNDVQTKNSLVPNTFTGIRYGNNGTVDTAATGAQIASVLGSTAVTNATNAANIPNNYVTPAKMSRSGLAGQPLISGGAAGDPAYGTLGMSYGGTGATTQAAALINVMPAATRVGDILYCKTYAGTCTEWAVLPGNNSGSQFLSESSGGVPSWAPGGGGNTITSPNSTIGVGGTSSASSVDVIGAAGKILAGATPALTSTPTLGVGGSTTGTLTLESAGGASGSVTLTPGTITAAYTATLPAATGTLALTSQLPANESGASNNFLTAYNSSTGAWTKARPTWANIDKTTSSIADLATRTCATLSDAGTGCTATIASYALLASPTFTGTPSLPTGTTGVTQTAGDNSTKLATTAYTDTGLALKAPIASPTFTGTVTAPEFISSASTDQSLELPNSTSPTASSASSVKLSAQSNELMLSKNTGTYYGVATTSGTKTTGKQLDFDANGNIVASAYDVGAAGGGTTTNAATFNNSGSGAASGTTFDGSAARTISYNTLGAAPLDNPTFTTGATAPFFASNTSGTGFFEATRGTAPSANATSTINRLYFDSSGTLACVAGTGGACSVGGGSGTTTNALTFNNSGTGDTSGSTFNGSAAKTLSYNSIGAAPLASPTFTGTPSLPTGTTATTQSQGNNSTALATTAYVDTGLSGKQATLTNPVTGPASPTAGYLTKWGASGDAIVDGPKIGTFTDAKWCSFTTAAGIECTQNAPGGSGTVTVVSSGSLTSTALVTGGGTTTLQTPSATATMDSSGNISTPGYIQTTGTGAGYYDMTEGTAPSGAASHDMLYADSTTHRWMMKNNNGAAVAVMGQTEADLPAVQTIVGSGTISTLTERRGYVICTTTCTVTIPAPVAGNQYCVRNAPGSATVITLAARASTYYELTDHSAWATVNQKMVSGAAANSSICIVGYDGTHYATMSNQGTWTDTP